MQILKSFFETLKSNQSVSFWNLQQLRCVSVMSGWSVLVEAFLGLIPRQCPQDPLPEPLAIRNCSSDDDCWPRLCCPDGDLRFCRTPAIMWDSLALPTLRLLTRKCCRWCGNTFTDNPHHLTIYCNTEYCKPCFLNWGFDATNINTST